MFIKSFIKKVRTGQGQEKYSWLEMQNLLIYIGLTSTISSKLFNEYMIFVTNLVHSYGPIQCCKILKDLASHVAHITLGKGFSDKRYNMSTYGGIWFSCFRNGIPKQLKILNSIVFEYPKAANTICAIVRLFITKPNHNIDSIINEPTYDTKSYTDFMTNFSIWVKLNIPEEKESIVNTTSNCSNYGTKRNTNKKWHTSFSAGPNGVAMLTCLQDFKALKTWKLYHDFLNLCNIVGLSHLVEGIELLNDSLHKTGIATLGGLKDVYLARIAYLSDKAGKTRVVYILNYYLQEALLPIHEYFMSWLKAQPQDGTYKQSSVSETVRLKTEQNIKCWCFDLTAATDRWPILHQLLVVQQVLGRDLSTLWYIIMSVKPFDKIRRSLIGYSVGQPMGALSSWAVFAVTHHYTMRYLCSIHNIATSQYVILGDDLVIFDEVLAQAYIETASTLGIIISQSKSITPENLIPGVSSAEFAKKLFRNGFNLSPYSSALLWEIVKGYKFYKAIDFFNESVGYMMPMVAYYGSTILLHPFLAMVYGMMDQESKYKLLILLGSNLGRVTYVLTYGPHPDWLVLDNPWCFNPLDHTIQTLEPQLILGSLVSNELEIKYKQLSTIKNYIHTYNSVESNPDVSKDSASRLTSIQLPGHPLTFVMERLTNDLNLVIRSIDQGTSDIILDGFLTGIEAQFYIDIIINKLPYKTYISNKERNNKFLSSLVIKVFKQYRASNKLSYKQQINESVAG